jgi:hypothetical protein
VLSEHLAPEDNPTQTKSVQIPVLQFEFVQQESPGI